MLLILSGFINQIILLVTLLAQKKPQQTLKSDRIGISQRVFINHQLMRKYGRWPMRTNVINVHVETFHRPVWYNTKARIFTYIDS